MKKKFLITGRRGFIGGHLANFYHKKGFLVVSADVKKKNSLFQVNSIIKNIIDDCRDLIICDRVIKNIDCLFNLSCDIGGIRFFENNK
jgi:nucleoside-diphosphate-sugar epimerase